MKILIVDDSKAMRRIVMRTMRQAGFGDHQFEGAEDGRQALELIRTEAPDLVLCDWNMRELNGLELLEQLNAENISVKFGFVTSESSPESRQIAMDAGALFVITKPFTADTFKETLGGFMN